MTKEKIQQARRGQVLERYFVHANEGLAKSTSAFHNSFGVDVEVTIKKLSRKLK